MKNKLLVFDIDGTLLTSDQKILESTKEALKMVRAGGHETVIATGRNAKMAKEIIRELEFDHFIVTNGAEGFYNHETIYKNVLDKEALQRLFELADLKNHSVVYQTSYEVLRRYNTVTHRIRTSMKFVGMGIPEFDESGRFYRDNDLTQLLLFVNADEEEMFYTAQTFPEFRFVRWHEHAIDVLPANGSKFETVSYIAEKRGFHMDHVITFGDGYNDIEMIREAGIGVAMGNAVLPLKEVADFVTDTNDNDGIYKALHHLKLLKVDSSHPKI